MKIRNLVSLTWMLPLACMSAYAQGQYKDYTPKQLNALNPANNKIANGINFGSYFEWCDQYPQFLSQTITWADRLLDQFQYANAKRYAIGNLTLLANPAIFPNTQFRPYLFTQVQRSLALVKMLDKIPTTNQVQHDYMVTSVALGQMDFLLDIYDASDFGGATFDRDLVIPYTRDCRGNCRAEDRAARRAAIQGRLIALVRHQLETAQTYSSSEDSQIVVTPWGTNTYDNATPLVDSDVYFNIITNVGLWAATDLSYLGFSQEFSCVITELLNLRSEAHTAQTLFGNVQGFRYIHSKVDTIIDLLSAGTYGCGVFNYDIPSPFGPQMDTPDGSGPGPGPYVNPYTPYFDGNPMAPTKQQHRKVKRTIKHTQRF